MLQKGGFYSGRDCCEVWSVLCLFVCCNPVLKNALIPMGYQSVN